MRLTPRKITILIVGIVFTAGFAVSFVIPVFAGDNVPGLQEGDILTLDQIPGGRVSTKNYNSSLSNKSAGQVRMDVGNILLSYGVGGADINKVTDALEGGGVYEAELKSFLTAIGINEEGVQKILVGFDGLGIGINEEGIQGVSTPVAGDTTQGAIPKLIITPEKGDKVSAPAVGDTPQPAEGGKNDGAHKRPGSAVSVPDTGGASPKAAEKVIRDNQSGYFPMQSFMLEIDGVIQAGFKEISGIESETEIIEIKDGDDMTIRKRPGPTRYSNIVLKRGFINDPAVVEWIKNGSTQRKSGSIIVLDRAGQEVMRYNLFEAWPLKRTEPVFDVDNNVYAIEEIELVVERVYRVAVKVAGESDNGSKEGNAALEAQRKYRRVLLQQGVQESRKALKENAKGLRDNFRENDNVKITLDGDPLKEEGIIGHVDHGKTARIAVAHGKGLRMINRFRSAMARFDHILGRLESRVEKFKAQGIDVSSTVLLIEGAKNMSVENEAKMEELKAKYESLLLGENAGGIAEEARAIAKELKTETENLHGKLREIADGIKQASKDYNSSISNSSSIE